MHHHVHKNVHVHFPSQEEGGLATIRVFSRTARPASLSQLGEETETDTDGDSSSTGLYGNGGWPRGSGKYVDGSTFPFPRLPANAEKKSPLNPSKLKKIQYSIDWSASSVIPRENVNRGNEIIFFESLQVVDGENGMGSAFLLFYLFPANFVPETTLEGSILVRNITYQKIVMVRYTIDEWETMNDVSGWYDGNAEGWDRFKFSISLDGQGLEEKVVWLVGKYAGGAGEAVEWWDNNEGKNYRVGFKEVVDQEERIKVYKRSVVVSAPSKFCLSFVKRYALIDNIATYTSPAPTSTITRPKLSDPQISPSTIYGQSTLARLKNLKLKNYAAPRGYAYGQSFSATKETTLPSSPKLKPLVLTLTSASPTTSSFVRSSGSSPPSELPSVQVPNLSLNTSLKMSSPTLSTISTTTSRDSTPVHTPTRGDEEDGGEGWKVGGEEEERWTLDGHFIPGDRNTYASYPKSGGVEMVRGEEKNESAYESTNGGGGSGLMPPQRRRGSQQKRGSGTSSSSASDSNSKSSKLPTSTASTPIPIPKQKPKLPKLDVPSPTFSPPTSTSVTSPSGAQSPYPRQGLGYNSPPQPQKHGHHRHQSMPSSVTNSKSPSSPEDSDAIYQALVREWCFAQGSSNSTSGEPETTSVIVKSPSPLGLICALDDGE